MKNTITSQEILEKNNILDIFNDIQEINSLDDIFYQKENIFSFILSVLSVYQEKKLDLNSLVSYLFKTFQIEEDSNKFSQEIRNGIEKIEFTFQTLKNTNGGRDDWFVDKYNHILSKLPANDKNKTLETIINIIFDKKNYGTFDFEENSYFTNNQINQQIIDSIFQGSYDANNERSENGQSGFDFNFDWLKTFLKQIMEMILTYLESEPGSKPDKEFKEVIATILYVLKKTGKLKFLKEKSFEHILVITDIALTIAKIILNVAMKKMDFYEARDYIIERIQASFVFTLENAVMLMGNLAGRELGVLFGGILGTAGIGIGFVLGFALAEVILYLIEHFSEEYFYEHFYKKYQYADSEKEYQSKYKSIVLTDVFQNISNELFKVASEKVKQLLLILPKSEVSIMKNNKTEHNWN